MTYFQRDVQRNLRALLRAILPTRLGPSRLAGYGAELLTQNTSFGNLRESGFLADADDHDALQELELDQDLRVMEPQYAFCGLYDRIERINRAYDEELKRRGPQ